MMKDVEILKTLRIDEMQKTIVRKHFQVSRCSFIFLRLKLFEIADLADGLVFDLPFKRDVLKLTLVQYNINIG